MTRYLKPKEVADTLGLSVKTLMRYVRAGRIRYINAGLGEHRRRYLFTESDLAEFEEANRRRDVEVTLCPSFSRRTQNSTATTSGGEVVAFTALRSGQANVKPKRRNG